MEFAEAVRRRRMIRSYDPERPVDRKTLSVLLNLANRAPSAGHTPGREFLVLDDITSRESFWSATSSGSPDRWLTGMRTAPVLVLCLADKAAYLRRYAAPDKGWSAEDESRWPVPYWDVDTGMAAMVLLLAVQDLGLAACFFGVPADKLPAVHEALRIPERLRIVGVVSIGHAADGDRSRPSRSGTGPLPTVVHYGAFGS